MIFVDGNAFDIKTLESEYPADRIESKTLKKMAESAEQYRFDSIEQLKFELRMRAEIINASYALHQSGLGFEVFRNTRCNTDFWTRRDDGGFVLKPGVKASAAIRDIYENGSKYGTECATAMQIVYYKALLTIFPENVFDEMFPQIRLMNWHDIERDLIETGYMLHAKEFLPGDRLYFANPDVDPKTIEWQGENVIDLGNDTYYGHGIGIQNAENIISSLNQNRKLDAQISAYLMDLVGRPNFNRLHTQYEHLTDTIN